MRRGHSKAAPRAQGAFYEVASLADERRPCRRSSHRHSERQRAGACLARGRQSVRAPRRQGSQGQRRPHDRCHRAARRQLSVPAGGCGRDAWRAHRSGRSKLFRRTATPSRSAHGRQRRLMSARVRRCDQSHAHAAVFETRRLNRRQSGRELTPIDLEEHAMKIRSLLLGLVATGLTQGAATAGSFDLLQIKLHPDVPEIAMVEVDGKADGRYNKVITKTLKYGVYVRGDRPANAVPGASRLNLSLDGGDWISDAMSEEWKSYTLTMPYLDP